MESFSSYDEQPVSAEALVHSVVSTHDTASGDAILSSVQYEAGNLSAEEQKKAEAYVRGMQEATRGMVVEKCAEGEGGYYDGSRTVIASHMFDVHGNLEETVEHAAYVKKHEDYHAQHAHTVPMKTVDGTLQLGGVTLTQEQFIEGLNVHDTDGHSFVSREYVQHTDHFVQAVAAAQGRTMSDVRAAINDTKDLTKIDDRTQHGALSA